MKIFSCLFLVMLVLASAAVAEEQSKVFDSFAEEMLETLDSNVKVAIQPFNSKKVDLPKKITTGFNNRLVDSLLKKSNFKISIIERGKLEDIWKEAEEFGNADFEKLVKEADAEILIIGDLRLRKGGVEISYRGYDLRQGKRGKIIASTRTQNLDFDLAAETSIPVSDELGEVFLQIMKSGGIIANAKKPEEFYANARMYEQKGDSGNARRSYAKFFTFNLDYIDPHLRYQRYLKIQEGREGAREVYFEMKEDSKSFVTEYTALLLLSRKMRVKKLKKFMEKHPEFGPGYFELSKEFSEARLGEQTARDKASEKKYLKKFFELHEQGKLLKYFMDKSMASNFLSNAKKRMTALQIFDESAVEDPVDLTFRGGKHGMMYYVMAYTIDETSKILYKCVGDGEFRDTGLGDAKNPKTGKKMPNQWFNCPAKMSKGTLYVKYTDLKGEGHGPFEIGFDPDTIEDASSKFFAKRLSEMSLAAHIHYTYGTGEKPTSSNMMPKDDSISFQLQQYVCLFDKIMYAFDDEENLNKEFVYGSVCDPEEPGRWLPNEKVGQMEGMRLNIPAGTKFVALQLISKDGEKGNVEIIKPDPKERAREIRVAKINSKRSRKDQINRYKNMGWSNCKIKAELDRSACIKRETSKGKEGDTGECESGLSTGAQIGLSFVPYIGGLLAMGAMLADGVADEGDDCSLEETVETKDTEPSTGNEETVETKDTEPSTGNSDETDLWEDEYE